MTTNGSLDTVPLCDNNSYVHNFGKPLFSADGTYWRELLAVPQNMIKTPGAALSFNPDGDIVPLSISTITGASLVGTDMKFTKDDGTEIIVDVSNLRDDTFIAGGSFDSSTKSLKLTRVDNNGASQSTSIAAPQYFESIETASLNNTILTFTKFDSNTFNVSLAGLLDDKTLEATSSVFQVKEKGIGTIHIGDSAVTTAKIVDANVTTAKIADANVTTTKIANGAVTTTKIADANVTTAKIVDANVTTAKIADANVTTAKIANGAVTTTKIADANVTTAKIADANVTTAKIANGAVTTTKIADANVTTAKIADANVTTAKIADANVTTAKIADANVTTAKLTDTGVSAAAYPPALEPMAPSDGGPSNATQAVQMTVDSKGRVTAASTVDLSQIRDAQGADYKGALVRCVRDEANNNAAPHVEIIVGDGSTRDGAFRFYESVMSMENRKIANLLDPVDDQDAVTKKYLYDRINGLSWMSPAQLASKSDVNIGQSLADPFDGVAHSSLPTPFRILLAGQTNAYENGVWEYNGSWSRPSDYANGIDARNKTILVEEGSLAGNIFSQTTNTVGLVVGTATANDTTWTQITGGITPTMTGATTLAAGNSGLAPQPAAGTHYSALLGNATFGHTEKIILQPSSLSEVKFGATTTGMSRQNAQTGDIALKRSGTLTSTIAMTETQDGSGNANPLLHVPGQLAITQYSVTAFEGADAVHNLAGMYAGVDNKEHPYISLITDKATGSGKSSFIDFKHTDDTAYRARLQYLHADNDVFGSTSYIPQGMSIIGTAYTTDTNWGLVVTAARETFAYNLTARNTFYPSHVSGSMQIDIGSSTKSWKDVYAASVVRRTTNGSSSFALANSGDLIFTHDGTILATMKSTELDVVGSVKISQQLYQDPIVIGNLDDASDPTTNTTAPISGQIAIGIGAKLLSNGVDDIVIGSRATCTSTSFTRGWNVVIGPDAYSTGGNCIVIGEASGADGDAFGAIAMGYQAYAWDKGTNINGKDMYHAGDVVIGHNSGGYTPINSNDHKFASVCIGYASSAQDNSISIGDRTKALGEGCILLGSNARITQGTSTLLIAGSATPATGTMESSMPFPKSFGGYGLLDENGYPVNWEPEFGDPHANYGDNCIVIDMSNTGSEYSLLTGHTNNVFIGGNLTVTDVDKSILIGHNIIASSNNKCIVLNASDDDITIGDSEDRRCYISPIRQREVDENDINIVYDSVNKEIVGVTRNKFNTLYVDNTSYFDDKSITIRGGHNISSALLIRRGSEFISEQTAGVYPYTMVECHAVHHDHVDDSNNETTAQNNANALGSIINESNLFGFTNLKFKTTQSGSGTVGGSSIAAFPVVTYIASGHGYFNSSDPTNFKKSINSHDRRRDSNIAFFTSRDNADLGPGDDQNSELNPKLAMLISPDGRVGIGGAKNLKGILQISQRHGDNNVVTRNRAVPFITFTGSDTDAKADTVIGDISRSGESSVVYNTSSDYRVKKNVTDFSGGLGVVNALLPKSFNFIDESDESKKTIGFLAHEVSPVTNGVITGEKDAIDEDGSPLLQKIDHSKLVPYLVSAVKELSAANQALMARVASLEGAIKISSQS